MKKQIPIALFLLILLVLGGWSVLKKMYSIHPLKALPPYVSQVVHFSFFELEKAKDLPANFRPQAKDFELLKQAFSYWLDKDFTMDSIIHYVYDRNNPGTVSSLMILKSRRTGNDINKWAAFIPDNKYSEHTYRGKTIIHYEMNREEIYYFATVRGLILLSSDQRMVERSIAHLKGTAPGLFKALRRMGLSIGSDNPSLQVYMNTGELNQPQWNQLKWFKEERSDSINGFDFRENEEFQKKLNTQQAVDFSALLKIIPDRIQLVDMISVAKPAIFLQKKEKIGPQLWVNSLQEQIGEKVAYVKEDGSLTEKPASFLVAFLKDQDKVEKDLMDLANQNGLLEEHQYQNQMIRRIIAEEVSSPFFGDQYPDIKNPYYIIRDGFLVCSNDLDRLKLWLDYLLVQKSLAQAEWMSSFFSFFKSKSQRLLLWHDPVEVETKKTQNTWQTDLMYSYDQGILNWYAQGKKWKIAGKLNNEAKGNALATPQWRKDFQKDLIFGPYLLRDHLTKKEHSLWIQDEEHHLKVYDLNGQLIWDMDLESSILGEIHTFQINPKDWGLIFNTEKRIYKLDSEGSLLSNWALNIEARQGLQLAHFGEEGDPHFFLPTQQNRIYGYTILGDAIINWNPYVLEENAASPVFHIASPARDYHFWLDQNKSIKAKYRSGEDVKLSGAPQDLHTLFFSKNNKSIYSLSTDGELGYLSSDLGYTKLKRLDNDFLGCHFSDLGESSFLLVWNKQNISRLHLEGKKINTQEDIPIGTWTQCLGLIQKKGKYFTLVFNEKKQQINLIDDQGMVQLQESIPGQSTIQFYKQESHYIMVTKLGEKLVVYKLPD